MPCYGPIQGVTHVYEIHNFRINSESEQATRPKNVADEKESLPS